MAKRGIQVAVQFKYIHRATGSKVTKRMEGFRGVVQLNNRTNKEKNV